MDVAGYVYLFSRFTVLGDTGYHSSGMRLIMQADKEMRRRKEKEVHLEETARLINRAFTTCMTDRYCLFRGPS